ncbi:MAG: S1C family serine protease [Acidimicrobiia bacterium]
MEQTRESRRGPGLLAAVAYFVGVAVLVAIVSAVVPPSPTPEAAPASTTTTTTVISTTTAVPRQEVQAPSFTSEEPIADAAERILPSVVQIQTTSGIGSGVIFDSDGLIVTAAHVVEGEQEVRIRFYDGEQVLGRVLGADGAEDIAVIQVDEKGLPAAEFVLEKPRVGQLAIAVGSPWGLQSTVTAGIISAVDQANCDAVGVCVPMVQTDAAINPGNSGGALVDRYGRVVGINVSIFSLSGANDGVGFAVPSEIVTDVANRIVAGLPLDYAYLGVRSQDVEIGQAGAVILEVVPGTAAAEAGLEVGDVVIALDGVPIRGAGDLAAQVRAHRPDDTAELVVLRDGEEITLEVTFGIRPDELN